MATQGFEGMHITTRNYGATAAFWKSLGFESTFETDHGSGQWQHPAGGPYVFISEQHDRELTFHPILSVEDAAAFKPDRAAEFISPFEPQHWNVLTASILDPDGRTIVLQAPLPDGVAAPDADTHHKEKYG